MRPLGWGEPAGRSAFIREGPDGSHRGNPGTDEARTMRCNRSRRRSAFTLIELLVVIAVIGLPDTQQYPGVLGDYAANGGQFAGAIVDNPLCNGVMCQAESRLTNDQVVETKSQTRLRDILDGTSNTFLVGEKHVPRSKYW